MLKLIGILFELTLIYLRIKPIKLVYEKVRVGQFLKFIRLLMHKTKGSGSLFIENNGSDKCIVFNKLDIEGETYLSLVLPIAPWSTQYVSKFKDSLSSENIPYELVDANDEAKSFLKGYVTVFGLPNVRYARKVAEMAVKVLDIQRDEYFTLRFVQNEQSET